MLHVKFVLFGPSEEIRMSISSVSVFSLFLGAVLILFSVEKRRSQSAVETGKTRATAESFEKEG